MNKLEATVMRRDGLNPRVLAIAITFILVVAAVLVGYLV
jgi:hypothetical protein